VSPVALIFRMLGLLAGWLVWRSQHQNRPPGGIGFWNEFPKEFSMVVELLLTVCAKYPINFKGNSSAIDRLA
jgi:hypothetical protein